MIFLENPNKIECITQVGIGMNTEAQRTQRTQREIDNLLDFSVSSVPLCSVL